MVFRIKSLLLLLACLAVLLGSCTLTEKSLQDRFQGFVELHYSDDRWNLHLPSGRIICHLDLILNMEDTDFNPNVTLLWNVWGDTRDALDGRSIRRDFKYLGELVIAFADSQGWGNDYHLYMKTFYYSSSHLFISYLYDYETNRLYPPEGQNLLREILDTFGSLKFEEIASTGAGRTYLLRHRYARIKHGKFESTWSWFSLGSPDAPFEFNSEGGVNDLSLKYYYRKK